MYDVWQGKACFAVLEMFDSVLQCGVSKIQYVPFLASSLVLQILFGFTDWNEHKTICKVRQQLQALNEEYIMEMMPDEEPDYDEYGLSDSDGPHSGEEHLSEGGGDELPESDEEPET
jgi:hypothetical protein